MNSMAAYEYRAESHVTDRLERENAQLKAMIAEQKELLDLLKPDQRCDRSCILSCTMEADYMKEQAELIETLAEALKYEYPPLEDGQYWENIMGEWCLMRNGECLYDVTGDPREPSHIREALAAYKEWKKCPTNHI